MAHKAQRCWGHGDVKPIRTIHPLPFPPYQSYRMGEERTAIRRHSSNPTYKEGQSLMHM